MAEFQPIWDENTLRGAITSYSSNPQSYTPELKETIQQHASYYNVPFYEGEFEITDAIAELGKGFAEGFTTLNLFEPADNEYEAIFRSIGHLGGFAPGVAAGPLKAVGLLSAANLARKLNNKSIPMMFANAATKGAKKLVKPLLKKGRTAQAGAVSTVSNFMLGNRAKHIAEGAFHLGAASAISSWQGGVDQMMSSFIHGGMAGGAFRAIGNFIKTGSEEGNKIARHLAGSLFMGIPSTMRGATTPEQVYDYLLGAWFGGKERPWTVAKAGKFIQKFEKDASEKPELRRAMDPTEHPDFEKLPAEVQPIVKEMAEKIWNKPEFNRVQNWLFTQLQDIDLEDIPEGYGEFEKYTTKTGEVKVRIKEKSLAKFKNFIITGGGAGTESFVSKIAKKRGAANIHMVTKAQRKAMNQKGHPGYARELSKTELEEANEAVTQANEILGKKLGNLRPKEMDLIRKNYFVVKNADAVYLVGNLIGQNNRIIKPTGSGVEWAHQMAVNEKKPTYMFDKGTNEWMKWKGGEVNAFTPIKEPPKPPRAIAFVGDRYIPQPTKNALISYFNTVFKKPSKVSRKTAKIADEEDVAPKGVGDADVGGKISNAKEMGSRAFNFVSKYMKDLYKGEDIAPIKAQKMAEHVKEVQESLEEYLNVGEKENQSDVFLDKMQEKYGFVLKGEAKTEAENSTRQWFTRRNSDVPVDFIAIDSKKGAYKLNPDNPISAAGNPKKINEPLKLVDVVWKDVYNKKGRAFAVLDYLTVETKDGLRDIPLSTFRRGKENKGMGLSEYDIMISKMLKKMETEKAGGYYYFGGKAADDKIIMMKFHPEADKISDYYIRRMFNSRNLVKLRNNFVGRFAKKESFTKKQAKIYFDKSFKSNVLWHLSKNGMEISEANIEKLTKNRYFIPIEGGKARHYIQKSTYDKLPLDRQRFYKPEFHFISNAKNWNKRSQIWMTDAYSGDKDFYRKGNRGYISDMSADGNFKYMIINDLSEKQNKLDHRLSNLLSTENPEHIDGAIITRSDVLKNNNLDAGTASDATQNKSFIVSPHAERGALLGKYMMHDAGKSLSAEMKKQGIHYLIQESSAKQRGGRDFNTIYDDLSPEHIKFSYSVTQGSDWIKPQSMKKQLLGNLVSALSFKGGAKMQKVVNDIFNNFIQPRYEGDTVANKSLEKYLRLSPETSDIELNRQLEKLDLEKIGIEPLVEALKKPGNQLFARKVYDEIFRFQKEDIEDMYESGEVDKDTYESELQRMEEFHSVQERIIREGNRYADENNKSGNGVGIYGHTFVKDYRMSVLSNWIIKQATQPKIDNSGSARIRPYDFSLQRDSDKVNKRLKDLNKDDTLFFLDNAYKNMWIETDIPGVGRIKLNELWKMYDGGQFKGKNKTEVEEIFRSAVMRVPMDSVSGAQILKFSGFTGRQGHGILMHSRAMRALGGADLDGDSAYFYMGGKRGFQKEWKDVYEDNKKEFYKMENGREIIMDNKDKEYVRRLAKSFSPEDEALMNSSEGLFSPNTRMFMSQGAVEGRALLGGAAVQPKQVMASVYNALASKGSDTFTMESRVKDEVTGEYETITTEVTIEAKKGKEAKDNIRKLTRAMVGLSSDPMDYAGLKEYEHWWRLMYNAHFEIKDIRVTEGKGKKKKVTVSKAPHEDINEINIWDLKAGGLFGKIEGANSAYYGRNYSKSRKWTMDEKRFLTSQLHTLTEDQLNTMTPKIARMVSDIDYSDSPLRRMDKEKIQTLYKAWKSNLSEMDGLKRALGRTSFAVGTHKYINAAMGIEKGAELITPEGFRKVLMSPRLFKMAIAETPYAKIKEFQDKFNHKHKGVQLFAKREALIDIRDKGNDYIVKDLTDLNTMRLVKEIVDKMTPAERGKNDSIIEEISKSVDKLKERSYLMARARYRYNPKYRAPEEDSVLDEVEAELMKSPHLKGKNGVSFLKESKEPETAYLDQATIDKTIKNLKSNKYTKKSQQDLFDTLLLGSLNRGDLKAIDALEASIGAKINKHEYQILSQLRADAARTSMSRLGFASNSVSDKSVRKFLGTYSDLFNEVSTTREEALVDKEAEKLVQEPQKQENIEKGLPEDPIRDLERFLTKTTGLEGLKDGKKGYEAGQFDAKTVDYIHEVVEMLKTESNKVGQEFPNIVRSLLHKDFNLMNKQDWLYMRNWFKDIKTGTLWQRLKKGEFTKLSERHYIQFPETINRELMKDEIILMQEKGLFLTADGVATGDVQRPTQYMDIIQTAISKTQQEAVALGEEHTNELNKDLLFIQDLTDYSDLHELAIRFRELPLARKIKQRGLDDKINAVDAREYEIKYREALERTNYDANIKNKEYAVTINGERVKMTGEKIIERINDKYTGFFKKMHRIITGDVPLGANGEPIHNIPLSLKGYYTSTYDKAGKSPIIDHTKFVKNMSKRWQQGKGLPLDFGIDGLHLVARSMMIEMTKDPVLKRQYMATDPNQTRKIDFENYWPHLHFSKNEALGALKRYAKHIRTTDLSDAEMEAQLNKLTYRHHALTGDWNFADIDEWREFDLAKERVNERLEKKDETINYFNPNKKVGSMNSRESHLPGWSIDGNAANSYSRGVFNAYYRQMGQILSRNAVNDFGRDMFKKFGKEQTDAWQTFMKLYIQGASGNPDIVPQSVLDNKAMSINKTPFAWWADNRVKDRMNKIADKLGLLKKNLPENMRGIDVHQLRYLSNLEAKFELASLLAHPRSVVNNIFGGTMHTIQSTGFNTWRQARNIKELAKINPDWDSMHKVDRFVTGHGVLPEFLISELGLREEFQNVKGKEFLEKLGAKITRDPDLSKDSILDIAKKANLTRPLGELAAKFMSVPERALRRDAFMAHYLFWYKKFGGAIGDFNHPVIVDLAKKGVQATQFLYNAPFRPMFARTALGKVMTRFQLWGWNATRFRKDAIKQAKLYGFRGPEMERATRMMQMDLMVFAFGNLFAYSLFDTAMPAPWNWVQDTSEWLFGDEKERNRAFFGQWPRALAPLQIATPPILRLPMASMRAMLEDDWERVSGYYIYTMLPFGRIVRDFAGPNNLMENPQGLIDKWTGFPLQQLGRESKKIREDM